MSQSEVARLRQELEASAHAAWMGLHGLAEGVAKHQTITKRMESMQQTFQALADAVGDEEAMQIWIEVGNQQEEGKGRDQLQESKQHNTSSSPQPTELMVLVAQQEAQNPSSSSDSPR